MVRRVSLVTLLLGAVVLLMPGASVLADPVIALSTFNPTGYGQSTALNAVFGTEFRPNQPISVLELGAFDGNANGMATAHQMGIFTSAGVFIAGTTIPAGTGGRLDGPYDPEGLLYGSGFRYVALASPVALEAGVNYVIAVYYGTGSTDEMPSYPVFTTDPTITFVTSRYRYSGYPSGSGTFSSLVFPSTTSSNQHVMVSFTYDVVPEPATLGLLGLGLAVLVKRCRRQ